MNRGLSTLIALTVGAAACGEPLETIGAPELRILVRTFEDRVSDLAGPAPDGSVFLVGDGALRLTPGDDLLPFSLPGTASVAAVAQDGRLVFATTDGALVDAATAENITTFEGVALDVDADAGRVLTDRGLGGAFSGARRFVGAGIIGPAWWPDARVETASVALPAAATDGFIAPSGRVWASSRSGLVTVEPDGRASLLAFPRSTAIARAPDGRVVVGGIGAVRLVGPGTRAVVVVGPAILGSAAVTRLVVSGGAITGLAKQGSLSVAFRVRGALPEPH